MRVLLVPALAIAVATGCDSDRSSGVPNPPGPATITIAAESTDPLVSSGETREITAVARDANGAIIPNPSLTWRSNAPQVATVSGSSNGATITAVDDGSAVITAALGTIEGSLAFTVRRRIVAFELIGPDSIVPAGASMPLTVVARDGRQQEIRGLTGVTYASGNGLSVVVSPDGVVTALFNPFVFAPTVITATLVRDGVTSRATKTITVGSPAPPTFDIGGFMLTDYVEPDPAPGLGQGIVFFTLDGARVQFKTLWSLLSGPPMTAHIHGPATFGSLAPVLVELPLGSPQLSHGVSSGAFSASDIRAQPGVPPISLDSLVALMRVQGATYIDVHTSAFPNGELRGVLTTFIPPPGRHE